MDLEITDLSDAFSSWTPTPSGGPSFGSGIELLMNDKKTISSVKRSGIEIDDLTSLENDLNNLSNVGPTNHMSTPLFSNITSESKPSSVKFAENISIGKSTASADSPADSKTWDGYAKFNNIPMNPDVKPADNGTPQLSKEDTLREKLKYLRKLEALEKKGIELTKKYSMESPLMEMQGEYEMIMEEKARQNSVKFQGNMMMAVINGIEFLNNRFDPFEVKLDGWGEQINENINDYDDIFGELHDKYKSKATMAPELKLLFQLGGSAMMVHMTNTMFKTAMPGMDDILRQNPDLMNQFQKAAVNSMSDTNPGLSGFMNGLMSEQRQGPPPPVSTQHAQMPASRQGNNSYETMQMGRNNFTDDGINVKETTSRNTNRPEMKGPSDINDILAGLKTKTINIHESPKDTGGINNTSTISISDLKELQDGGGVPTRSKRRQKSDRNTISLDI
jgi:hypothetical protein